MISCAPKVINVQSRDVQVLCLNPTRELAVQVMRRFRFITVQGLLMLSADGQSY